jgi:hypothetical protein
MGKQMSVRNTPMSSLLIFSAWLLAAACHANTSDIEPAAACNYLAAAGLRTTTYRQQADGSYLCISPHVDVGTNPGSNGALNNIAYSVVGTTKSVDRIQLAISVNNPNEAKAIHRRLKDLCNVLSEKLHDELPIALQEAIATGSNAKTLIEKHNVAVLRKDFPDKSYAVQVIFD